MVELARRSNDYLKEGSVILCSRGGLLGGNAIKVPRPLNENKGSKTMRVISKVERYLEVRSP